jgi:hypothetical protein
MTDLMTSGHAVSAIGEADVEAFFRLRADVPQACDGALIRSLNRLRGSDDPVVTFAGLASACVPEFADGCRVELSDGNEGPFLVTRPAGPDEVTGSATANPVGGDQMLLAPFRVTSRSGYPSYAGVVTYWWNGRAPSESDAAIADLLVRHVIALVDRERLTAQVARAEDRAASLALEAVSGRTISLATGIAMHQNRLTADEAEQLLRRSARSAGTGLAQVAAAAVRSGALADSSRPLSRVPAWAEQGGA